MVTYKQIWDLSETDREGALFLAREREVNDANERLANEFWGHLWPRQRVSGIIRRRILRYGCGKSAMDPNAVY